MILIFHIILTACGHACCLPTTYREKTTTKHETMDVKKTKPLQRIQEKEAIEDH